MRRAGPIDPVVRSSTASCTTARTPIEPLRGGVYGVAVDLGTTTVVLELVDLLDGRTLEVVALREPAALRRQRRDEPHLATTRPTAAASCARRCAGRSTASSASSTGAPASIAARGLRGRGRRQRDDARPLLRPRRRADRRSGPTSRSPSSSCCAGRRETTALLRPRARARRAGATQGARLGRAADREPRRRRHRRRPRRHRPRRHARGHPRCSSTSGPTPRSCVARRGTHPGGVAARPAPPSRAASSRYGMQAADGAIETRPPGRRRRLRASDDRRRGRRSGICGSGLIDLLAELRRAGRMTPKGVFADRARRVIDVAPGAGDHLLARGRQPLAQAKAANTVRAVDPAARARGRPGRPGRPALPRRRLRELRRRRATRSRSASSRRCRTSASSKVGNAVAARRPPAAAPRAPAPRRAGGPRRAHRARRARDRRPTSSSCSSTRASSSRCPTGSPAPWTPRTGSLRRGGERRSEGGTDDAREIRRERRGIAAVRRDRREHPHDAVVRRPGPLVSHTSPTAVSRSCSPTRRARRTSCPSRPRNCAHRSTRRAGSSTFAARVRARDAGGADAGLGVAYLRAVAFKQVEAGARVPRRQRRRVLPPPTRADRGDALARRPARRRSRACRSRSTPRTARSSGPASRPPTGRLGRPCSTLRRSSGPRRSTSRPRPAGR